MTPRLAMEKAACGCTLQFQPFTKGVKFVTCQGSEGVWPHDVTSIDRTLRKPCAGGICYRVVAVPTVVYETQPADGGDAA